MIEIQPGLTYLTRDDWGARTDIPRLGHPVNRLDRTEAIMHHTVIVDNDATPNRWETLAEVKAKMVQLQTIRPDLGRDVPYNFVAFHMADGSLIVCEGRGLDLTGAHTHGHNTGGIATAGEGNFQIGQPVDSYSDHWSRWWGWLKFDQGMENLGSLRPARGIAFGHRDFIATGCPGDNLYAIIPQLTFQAAPEPPTPEPEPVPPEPAPPKEESMVIVIIKAENDGTQYILNTDGRKYRLGSLGHRQALNRLAAAGAIRIEYRNDLSAADVAAIPDEHA